VLIVTSSSVTAQPRRSRLDTDGVSAYKTPFFMVTRASIRFAILAILALPACGKGKARAPEAQAQGVAEVGLGSLPAETRVIVGASVPRLAASPLARRIIGEILGRDSEAQQRLAQLLARCKLDPARDLQTVTIAMAEGQDIAVLARGTIDATALVDCVRAETSGQGGRFGEKTVGGRTAYTATSQSGAQTVWLAFADRTVVAALSEAWLAKLLDPAAPKIDTRADTMALIKRVAPDAAIWGVGYLPPGVGGQLVKLTDNQVTQPAQSVAFEASFERGLVASLRMDMKTTADADKLATFAKGQLDWLAVAAQQWKLGPLVAKAQLTSEGPSVKLAVKLDDADVKRLEAALSDTPPAKKEQSK
jgi:hypothetical protein